MLKIEIVEPANGSTTIRLEGRVIGPWVAELGRMCEPLLAMGAKLTLDLTDVAFVDRDGVELFGSLRKRQVVLSNCSPFVAEQLKA